MCHIAEHETAYRSGERSAEHCRSPTRIAGAAFTCLACPLVRRREADCRLSAQRLRISYRRADGGRTRRTHEDQPLDDRAPVAPARLQWGQGAAQRTAVGEPQHAYRHFSRARTGAVEIVPSNSLADIALKVFDTASVRALKFAEILASSTELGRLVEALRAAPSVQVFGAGASGVVAFDLHQRLLRLGIRIGFAEDHHNQIASASLMAPGELAIAISYSGQTRPTLQATEVAHSRGATIAAVLGVHGSPLERLADIAIITPPGGKSVRHRPGHDAYPGDAVQRGAVPLPPRQEPRDAGQRRPYRKHAEHRADLGAHDGTGGFEIRTRVAIMPATSRCSRRQ